MAFVGTFMPIKKDAIEFEYDYVISEEGKLMSIMRLWPCTISLIIQIRIIDMIANKKERNYYCLYYQMPRAPLNILATT